MTVAWGDFAAGLLLGLVLGAWIWDQSKELARTIKERDEWKKTHSALIERIDVRLRS